MLSALKTFLANSIIVGLLPESLPAALATRSVGAGAFPFVRWYDLDPMLVKCYRFDIHHTSPRHRCMMKMGAIGQNFQSARLKQCFVDPVAGQQPLMTAEMHEIYWQGS